MIKSAKWCSDKNGIDPSWGGSMSEDFVEYKTYILEHVSFITVLKYFKLKPEVCPTGKYTHRMVCPFSFHKNGKERTGSFRLDEKKGTYMCFGCTEGGDVLKFLQLYRGGAEEFNLRRLAVIGGLIKDGEMVIPDNYIEPEVEPPKKTNHRILFNAGILLRQYLLDLRGADCYNKECEWVDQMLIKIDKYFAMIDEENLIDAEKIYDNLNSSITRRKGRSII